MKLNKLILILLVSFIMITLFNVNYVYATSITSDVLDDLSSDDLFDKTDYQEYYIGQIDDKSDSDIKTINIIRVAESNLGVLFIYTYQPLNGAINLIAKSISISYGFSKDGQDLKPMTYDLTLVSRNGVFCKYLVDDFIIKNDDESRYYNIVAIYRDVEPVVGDDIAEGSDTEGYQKGIGVGQQWHRFLKNGKVFYEYTFFDTLKIDVKFTGCLEFSGDYHLSDALLLSKTNCLSWFICFDLEDYVAKHIYDADLVYQIRDWSVAYSDVLMPLPELKDIGFGNYGDWSEDIPLTLTDTDIGTYSGTFLNWFSLNYKWNRISNSKDYLKNADDQKISLNDDTRNAIENSQWVFSFLETDITTTTIPTVGTSVKSKDISEITVLRIKFLNSDGNIYNLGVVSDRVNPDNKIDGKNTVVDDDLWKKIIIIICSILLLSIILKIINSIDYKKKKSKKKKKPK